MALGEDNNNNNNVYLKSNIQTSSMDRLDYNPTLLHSFPPPPENGFTSAVIRTHDSRS